MPDAKDDPLNTPDRAAVDVTAIAAALAPYGLVGGCLWAVVHMGTVEHDLLKQVVLMILGGAFIAINPRAKSSGG